VQHAGRDRRDIQQTAALVAKPEQASRLGNQSTYRTWIAIVNVREPL